MIEIAVQWPLESTNFRHALKYEHRRSPAINHTIITKPKVLICSFELIMLKGAGPNVGHGSDVPAMSNAAP